MNLKQTLKEPGGRFSWLFIGNNDEETGVAMGRFSWLFIEKKEMGTCNNTSV
jgi:hypothetical protein